jgi:hypothetical protein
MLELFDRGIQEREVDPRVSATIDRFLAATLVSTPLDFEALSGHFRNTRIPTKPEDAISYLERIADGVVAHSINTSSPNYMGHMTSALPYFVRPLSRLITGLNQNLVKVETAKAFTPYEREAIGDPPARLRVRRRFLSNARPGSREHAGDHDLRRNARQHHGDVDRAQRGARRRWHLRPSPVSNAQGLAKRSTTLESEDSSSSAPH